MDDVEVLLASRRIAKWPREWRELIVTLPASEARLLAELVVLLDVRPSDEERTSE